MSEAEVTARAPRSMLIYTMRVKQHMGVGPIAAKLGISKATVCNGVKYAERLLAQGTETPVQREPSDCRRYLTMKSGARCRCGLLLPCHECLPPTFRVAAERNGASVGEF